MKARSHDQNERKRVRLRKALAAAAAALALCAGCVFSTHPWYVDGSQVPGTALVGEWSDGESLWIFLEGEDGLRLVHREDERLGEFRAVPFRAAGRDHLDLQPLDSKAINGFAASHLLAMHSLFRWALEGDTLVLTSLDLGRVEKLFQAVPPPGEKIEDRWVLTGSSAEVHDYLVRHLSADSLWTDDDRLGRLR